jgi:hypothetical protein
MTELLLFLAEVAQKMLSRIFQMQNWRQINKSLESMDWNNKRF